MKRLVRPFMALVVALGVGTYTYGADTPLPTSGLTLPPTGSGGTGGASNVPIDLNSVAAPFSAFANTSYGAQIGFDSFRYSVRKRMETMRIGTTGQPFGSPFRRPVGTGYSGGDREVYQNRGGGYYNQNYGNQGWNPPPQGQYNQNWNPPPLPAPSYNAPSNYDPYGGNVNTNWNNDTWNQQNFSQPYSYNSIASDSAYAMAPSSRSSAYSNARRRQLDCVYYSGFTVWGDLYQTWAKQKSRGNNDGYRYRTFGPAIGFDWTNGPMTFGAAMTYNWGKLKGRETSHSMKQHTWAIDFYGQYNTDLWYVNGNLGFAHNRYKSDRNFTGYHTSNNSVYPVTAYNHDSFNSNSWNLEVEYGWKLNWSGIQVVPYAGLRYFHDRRGGISESGDNLSIKAGGKNYHVLEVPMGVNFAYEIASGGMVFVPRARLAWIPELSRKTGGVSGSMWVNDKYYNFSESSAKRNRHGFLFGLGLEARLSKSLSAHLDYNCNFRSKQYEHHWNLGAGFTF